MKSMQIFFDIEGTIIDSFCNPVFLEENVQKLRSILEKQIKMDLHFFSFAIHNQTDEFQYEYILVSICEKLGIDRNSIKVIHKDSLFPLYKEKYGHWFTNEDFMDFSTDKEFGFELYIKSLLKDREVQMQSSSFILFDDKVENSIKLIKHDEGYISSIMLVDINHIENGWMK